MKKLILFPLLCALLVGTCCASGGNIDGGGAGDIGLGDGTNFWHGGEDGIRVTVVRSSDYVERVIMDFAEDAHPEVQRHFGKVSKRTYRLGQELVLKDTPYTSYPAGDTFPTIITHDGETSSIAEIKRFFTDEFVLRNIASAANMTYEELTVGENYKLLLEPMVYLTYGGKKYAMTATEAVLFNIAQRGNIRGKFVSVSHENLPLAMFLERSDLGFDPPRQESYKHGPQTDNVILNYLGLGIIYFIPPETDPNPPVAEYVYRTDTDVITAAYLSPDGEVSPDDDAWAYFDILGRTHRVNYVCPSGGKQLVWIKWHTPSEPQDFTIHVTSDHGGGSSEISVSVQEIPEKRPPDPVYDGPGIGGGQYQPNFRVGEPIDWGSSEKAEWSQWVPGWMPPQLIHQDDGSWHSTAGYWVYHVREYSTVLRADYALTPDVRVKTAYHLNDGRYEMKSGYGVNVHCRVKVIGGDGVTNGDVTAVQNVVAVFPEFQYASYHRQLEPERRNSYDTEWQFQKSIESYYDCRVHFTPLWYPNEMRYPVPLAIFDAWTPGGQLFMTATEYVTIDGGACLDDWYIRLLYAGAARG